MTALPDNLGHEPVCAVVTALIEEQPQRIVERGHRVVATAVVRWTAAAVSKLSLIRMIGGA